MPFQEYLNEEINRVKGVYYPVRASLLRRLLVRKARCKSLHPNPEDEFCQPGIGPNNGIISRYKKEYTYYTGNPTARMFTEGGILEPLIVQRTMPDGYMILNGHHRWAGAIQAGLKRVSVKIVNLTQEADIREMLRRANSDKRVTLDLDEVVFSAQSADCLERPLPFPMNRIYRERIRLGIPALFHYLNEHGYDIWVYTSKYYSMEYIRGCFRRRKVRLDGIVTGAGRRARWGSDAAGTLKKLMESKYSATFHIDNESVMRVASGSGECEEVRLSGSAHDWVREVMDAIGVLTNHE